MDNFKLPICSFSFEQWKVWWGNEGIGDIGGWLDGGEGFVRENHIPPLPLELMVMLEWECCVVRIKSGLTGMRSMWRM